MSLASELTSAQKLYKSGELDSALDCCKRAIKLPGGAKTLNLHLLFGANLHSNGGAGDGEKAFDTALDLDAESINALKGKAQLVEAYGPSRFDDLLPIYTALQRLDAGAAAAKKGKPTDWAAKIDALEKQMGKASISYADNYEGGAKKGRAGKPGAVDVSDSQESTKAAVSDAEKKRLAAEKYEARMAAAAAKAGKGGASSKGSSRGERKGGGDDDAGGAGEGAEEEAEEEPGGVEAQKAELADLRAKAASGVKLSGKQKRTLKKLEDAEERWKAYEAVSGGGGGGGGGDGGDGGAGGSQPGSQFVAEVRGADRGERASAMGDGIEIAEFSIRADSIELLVNARLSSAPAIATASSHQTARGRPRC